MSCGSLDRRGVWGRKDTWICMAESLHCPPETTTTFLISYTPIQNKTLLKKKKKQRKVLNKIVETVTHSEKACLFFCSLWQ